jgi:hypothetical protein
MRWDVRRAVCLPHRSSSMLRAKAPSRRRRATRSDSISCSCGVSHMTGGNTRDRVSHMTGGNKRDRVLHMTGGNKRDG